MTVVTWKVTGNNGQERIAPYYEDWTETFDTLTEHITYHIPRNGEIVGIVAKKVYYALNRFLYLLDINIVNDTNWYVGEITTYDITVER